MERAQVAPINQMLTQHLGPLTSLGSDNTPQPSAGLTPQPLALTEPAQEAAIRHSLLKWDRYNPMAGWQLYRTYPDQAEADYWFEFLSDHWEMGGGFDGTIHGWQVVPADEVEAFIVANNSCHHCGGKGYSVNPYAAPHYETELCLECDGDGVEGGAA